MNEENFELARKFAIENIRRKLPDYSYEDMSDASHAHAGEVIMSWPDPAVLEAVSSGRIDDDPDSQKSLLFGIAKRLEDGVDLPPQGRRWLARYLRGEIKLAARKGARRKTGRDSLIHHTVEDIVAGYGLNATRGEASLKLSAIDAVVDALNELKQSPNTYDAVRKIWQKQPSIRKHFR